MIITLSIKLVTHHYCEHGWSCDIEVDEDSDLEDLHCIIQDAVDFDKDHLWEFYVCPAKLANPPT